MNHQLLRHALLSLPSHSFSPNGRNVAWLIAVCAYMHSLTHDGTGRSLALFFPLFCCFAGLAAVGVVVVFIFVLYFIYYSFFFSAAFSRSQKFFFYTILFYSFHSSSHFSVSSQSSWRTERLQFIHISRSRYYLFSVVVYDKLWFFASSKP